MDCLHIHGHMRVCLRIAIYMLESVCIHMNEEHVHTRPICKLFSGVSASDLFDSSFQIYCHTGC